MKERDDSKPLTHYIQINDAYWGGKKRDGIRGRGATDQIPFVAAVSTDEGGNPLQIHFSQIRTFSKDAIKAWADVHLSSGSSIVSDGLRCFGVFEEIGYEHTALITGDCPQRVKIPDFKWVNTIIDNVK